MIADSIKITIKYVIHSITRIIRIKKRGLLHDVQRHVRFSRDQKEEMNPYLSLTLLLLVGFAVYFLIRDRIFDTPHVSFAAEAFSIPAPASIEIRQAPLYPERTITSSGPNPPNQEAPNGEKVVYGDPAPKDPYYEKEDSSDIPEHLRHPERSFRPAPMNNNTTIAVQSGVASQNLQVNNDNSQQFQQELIQGGGEFMPGIFANDTFNDASFSAF
jgi:hypothetical protein